MCTRKKLSELTLKDDFMFSAVMVNPKNCKPMLERILGIDIGSVTVDREKDETFLSVRDTGIGIPSEHQDRVFERFYRVDKSRSKATGGTGLGLAIVKHIVSQHGARLFMDSEPGRGTEIRVVFPGNKQ